MILGTFTALPAVASSDPIDAIEGRRAAALTVFDETVQDFAAILAIDPTRTEALSARSSALNAVGAEERSATADIDAIARQYRKDLEVEEAAATAALEIKEEADLAADEIRARYDAWSAGDPPPSSTTTTTTTTTTPSTTSTTSPGASTSTTSTTTTSTTTPGASTTSTTMPGASTTSTSTTAPTTAATTPVATIATPGSTTTTAAGAGGDTRPPPGGLGDAPGALPLVGGPGQAALDGAALQPSTFVMSSPAWDPAPDIFAAQEIVSAADSAAAGGGVVLSWIQSRTDGVAESLAMGPLVLLDVMARALLGAGEGLAAPVSLLGSITAALVIDRKRLGGRG